MKERGRVKFSNLPEGATISIIPGKSTVSVGLPAGQFEVSISAPGYYGWKGQVSVQVNDTIPIPWSPMKK
jgi:hypothetical protein